MTNWLKTAQDALAEDNALVDAAKRGDRAALNKLIRKHYDLVKLKANAFRAAPVPFAAILGEGMRLMVVAINKFDPNSGVRFRTFAESYLRGLNRYVQTNKRVDRVPEHRLLQIKAFQTQKDLLTTHTGHEPSAQQLSQVLGWSISEVADMEKALRQRSLVQSRLENQAETDAVSSRFEETGELLYITLTQEEQLVYDYSLGAHGKQKIKDVKILADRIGSTTDKVYKIKKKIADDLVRYSS